MVEYICIDSKKSIYNISHLKIFKTPGKIYTDKNIKPLIGLNKTNILVMLS